MVKGISIRINLNKVDALQYEGSEGWKKIVRRMPPWQSPNLYTIGIATAAFERSKPITI